MTTTISTRVEPFQERDHNGVSHNMNRNVAEIKVGDEVVWSDSVTTDDTIESVCDVRESKYQKATQHAAKLYEHIITEKDCEAGDFVIPARPRRDREPLGS